MVRLLDSPVNCVGKRVDALRRMQSLQTTHYDSNKSYLAAEFWKRYDAGEFKK